VSRNGQVRGGETADDRREVEEGVVRFSHSVRDEPLQPFVERADHERAQQRQHQARKVAGGPPHPIEQRREQPVLDEVHALDDVDLRVRGRDG
jgi:hypothetical protein